MKEKFGTQVESKFFSTFYGRWSFFSDVVRNPETIWVWDIDGILLNSTKIVFRDFIKRTGIKTEPAKIGGWNHLTVMSANVKNPKPDVIAHAEDGWYDPKILLEAPKYALMELVVAKTIQNFGAEKNFVLTSRNPDLEDITRKSLDREYPRLLPENLIIRKDAGVNASVFKSENLVRLASKAPWVVFVDDSTDFIKASLDRSILNLLAVNIPQGQIWPDFSHPNLMVVKRFPKASQSMYPFWLSMNLALR